ncbi:MAG: hypothetical protein ABI629_12460 [bacterium]
MPLGKYCRNSTMRRGRTRHVAWAELLRRTFALDVLASPDYGGRLPLLAPLRRCRRATFFV